METISHVFDVPAEYSQILNLLYDRVKRTELWQRINGSCFCMAGFVKEAFKDLGRQARILPCYAIAVRDNSSFLLGYKNGTVAPRQVDGHVVCLVDETVLVDFGLRNVQRYGWPDFYGAVACEVKSDKIFPLELSLDPRRKIIWRNDWINPATHKLMSDHRPIYQLLNKQCKAKIQLTEASVHQSRTCS